MARYDLFKRVVNCSSNNLTWLGSAVDGVPLYRARFASWQDADTRQRSKSRRKHDRQQGEKLDALGQVEFAELGNGPEAVAALTSSPCATPPPTATRAIA